MSPLRTFLHAVGIDKAIQGLKSHLTKHSFVKLGGGLHAYRHS